MRLKNKVALVTGGWSGIGRACCELFAREGAIVYSADRTTPPADFDTSRIRPVHLDVSRPQDWSAAIARIETETNALDVLVNNAGVCHFLALHETTLEQWNEVIAVDQTGVMLGMQSCLPLLGRRGGSIVNISSMFGLVAVPGIASYHAAKGAVLAMTRNVAVTYAGQGIRANAILPGLIQTPGLGTRSPEDVEQDLAKTPLGFLGQPSDVAYGALYLGSEEAKFVTGTFLMIDGGYTSL